MVKEFSKILGDVLENKITPEKALEQTSLRKKAVAEANVDKYATKGDHRGVGYYAAFRPNGDNEVFSAQHISNVYTGSREFSDLAGPFETKAEAQAFLDDTVIA